MGELFKHARSRLRSCFTRLSGLTLKISAGKILFSLILQFVCTQRYTDALVGTMDKYSLKPYTVIYMYTFHLPTQDIRFAVFDSAVLQPEYFQ